MNCEPKWIAYAEDGETLVAENRSAEKALEEAREKGVKDPVLAFCPPEGCASFYHGR